MSGGRARLPRLWSGSTLLLGQLLRGGPHRASARGCSTSSAYTPGTLRERETSGRAPFTSPAGSNASLFTPIARRGTTAAPAELAGRGARGDPRRLPNEYGGAERIAALRVLRRRPRSEAQILVPRAPPSLACPGTRAL